MSGPTKTRRLEVLARDEGRCVRCGAHVADPLDGTPWAQWSIQHRKPRGAGGTKDPAINAIENLIVLCGDGVRGCHGWVESNRVESRRLGYSVPQWQDPAVVPVAHRTWVWAWPHPDGEWVPAVHGVTPVTGEFDWAPGPYAKSLAVHRGIEIVPPGMAFQRLCSDLHDAINDTKKKEDAA